MKNEKNVVDNVFNTMMDINEKTKHKLKAREDIGWYCNQLDSKISEQGALGKCSKPKVCYILTNEQYKYVLEWVKELKITGWVCF